MMLGKIQRAGDINAFRNISTDLVDRIVKNASPAVINILSATVLSLCRKMNLPENEAKDYVQKVREGKMGYIFENMEKMDIQEERRKTDEQRKRAEEQTKRAEEAEKQLRRIQRLTVNLAESGRTEDIIRAAADIEYQKKLLQEFGL